MEVTATSDEIEDLLMLYLKLVNEYDLLRRKLCTLQISALQNLARANFNATRGIRYGEQLYDSRMQALRLCRATVDAVSGKKVFSVFTRDSEKKDPEVSELKKTGEETTGKSEISSVEGTLKEHGSTQTTENTSLSTSHDPISMFGILVPNTLRLAQSDSIKMVNLMPRIIELDAELAGIEIKIRRLRKHRSKERTEIKEDIDTTQL